MKWRIAAAKQRFPELVRAAGKEPQLVFNRDRLVAAVIDPERFAAFERWCTERQRRSLGEAFAELRRICEQEGGYELEIPQRIDRPNPFVAR